MKKAKVLFVCTHNSARSQMAEAFLRSFYGGVYDAFSAGVAPGTMNSFVMRAMKEVGIDMAGQYPKRIDDIGTDDMDLVFTVCDSAERSCPVLPGWRHIEHKSFPDPSSASGSDEEIMEQTRNVRDAIKDWIKDRFSDAHPNS